MRIPQGTFLPGTIRFAEMHRDARRSLAPKNHATLKPHPYRARARARAILGFRKEIEIASKSSSERLGRQLRISRRVSLVRDVLTSREVAGYCRNDENTFEIGLDAMYRTVWMRVS